MTDRLSPEERSENMRQIPSEDTSPEIAVRSLVHSLGYRYRLHVKKLPGKPDLVFAKRGCVIFVHGCFWHSHPGCREGRVPSTNTAYWSEKLARNRERDASHARALRKMGWRVMVIWECQTTKPENLIRRLVRFLDPSY